VNTPPKGGHKSPLKAFYYLGVDYTYMIRHLAWGAKKRSFSLEIEDFFGIAWVAFEDAKKRFNESKVKKGKTRREKWTIYIKTFIRQRLIDYLREIKEAGSRWCGNGYYPRWEYLEERKINEQQIYFVEWE
jgi:DNA-directed RNA polymerase specialized sigma subunit